MSEVPLRVLAPGLKTVLRRGGGGPAQGYHRVGPYRGTSPIKETLSPLGPSSDPRHRPTVGS